MDKRFLSIVYVVLAIIIFFVYGIISGKLIGVNYYYVSLACLMYVIVVFFRSIKFQNILSSYTHISIIKSASLTGISQFAGALIPGRAGELVLSTLVKLKYRLSVAKFLPTIVLDKLIELIAVTIYLVIASFIVGYNSFFDYFKNTNYFIVVIAGIFFIGVGFLGFNFAKRYGMKKVELVLVNIKDGLALPLAKPTLAVIMLVFSFSSIIAEYIFMYFLFIAFGFEISFFQIIIIHSSGMIIGVLSMIPGGHGATEISMLGILSFWGYDTSQALLPIITSKIITYCILISFGFNLLPDMLNIVKNIRNKRGENQNG